MEWVGLKRDGVDFSPRDADKIAAFLAQENARGASPVQQLARQLEQRARERRSAMHTEEVLVGEGGGAEESEDEDEDDGEDGEEEEWLGEVRGVGDGSRAQRGSFAWWEGEVGRSRMLVVGKRKCARCNVWLIRDCFCSHAPGCWSSAVPSCLTLCELCYNACRSPRRAGEATTAMARMAVRTMATRSCRGRPGRGCLGRGGAVVARGWPTGAEGGTTGWEATRTTRWRTL